jgi:UDP-N-acetylmuramoyl-tripeptide--D-alanyl-D-alanine ligase
MMTLAQAQSWLPNGKLVGDPNTKINRVHTDTRNIASGDLFVALRGEKFDAQEFLAQAKAAGAMAAIAHAGLIEAGLPGIVVEDTRLALGTLAAGWRAQFTLPLIAVTGSNGKTTVTQMLASILKAWKHDLAWATKGNLNNDIGVPLTLLGLKADHQAAVVELGMNHPGEITYLAALTKPTVALVNNAQREHLEFMQTVEAVAHENASVFAALPEDGVAVFPADDAFTDVWRGLASTRRVIDYAMIGAADVTARSEWAGDAWRVHAATPAGSLSFRLAVAGRHNVKNALAAISCALAVDVPLPLIAQGLEAFEPVKGRSRAYLLNDAAHTITLIDDSYNANPDSARAAVDMLSELPGPHLLVLGDMGEVGDQGPEFHAEVGEYAVERGIEHLLCSGELMRYCAAAFPGARHIGGVEALVDAVLTQMPHYRSILVKGSRFMKMERVVDALLVHTKNKKKESSDAH